MSTSSTNKGYVKQSTGENPNTWGTTLNASLIDIIDTNLGGSLSLSVAGSSDVALSTAQQQNLFYTFTGLLTGNISVTWASAKGGLFNVYNNTTGNFTLTVKPVGGTGVVIPQGRRYTVGSDGTTSFFAETQVTGYLSAIVPVAVQSSTVTITIASPGVITWANHGLPAGCPVSFTTTGALPTGLATGTTYYVTSGATLLTSSLTLSTTVANAMAGTSINTTGSQSGTHTAANATTQVPGSTIINLGGLLLTQGVWDVSGIANWFAGGSSVANNSYAWINTVSVAVPTTLSGYDLRVSATVAGSGFAQATGTRRITVASGTQVVYISGQAAISVGPFQANASIEARLVG